MRDTKFRTRLFLCFLAVIVMTLVLPGLYVRKNIKEDGIDETVRNARREAVLIRMQMETAPDGVHGLSSTFDRIGTELGIRITFIGADGTVLAESDSSRINLNDLDNHADRQEIGAALREGFGVSIRHSNTLDTDLVYAAIPFAAVGKLPDGFIRVAVPLKHVEERIAQSERQWLAIVGLATLIALLFAYGLSTHLERSLKEMIRVVESIATDPAGQGNRRRLHILPGREFRRLAHAVNDMADRTEEHLRTIAENKAQLKTILDVMNEGVLVIGEKGRIRLVNPALVRLFPQAKDAEGKFRGSHPGGGNPGADELLSAPQDKPRLITLCGAPPDMIPSVQFIRPREAIHDVPPWRSSRHQRNGPAHGCGRNSSPTSPASCARL
ncbi:MAG: PAS domain-containing protein [Bilophila wadsworthia]